MAPSNPIVAKLLRPQAISAIVCVFAFFYLRNCSFWVFCGLVVVPCVAYAVLGGYSGTPMSIRGKVVLVTGASSGIGRALAVEASKKGASKVLLLARRLEALEDAQSEVASHGAEAYIYQCDVTRPDAVRAVAQRILDSDMRPQVIINNAGMGAWKHIEDTTCEEAAEMMACPYQASFNVTRAFIPSIIESRDCHIGVVGSPVGYLGMRGTIGYGVARWAQRGFAESLRADLHEFGIGVTLIMPTETNGTEYFADKPGKAGSASQKNFPWLFTLKPITMFNPDTSDVARISLTAIENGEREVFIPNMTLRPLVTLAAFVPEAIEVLLRVGGNGLRSNA